MYFACKKRSNSPIYGIGEKIGFSLGKKLLELLSKER
jgi:hypothetical protein